mmetsp:Transcript_26625/g.82351  ORF Transcript_26625/g.82351 Transcript_26625/m.82351 type:complete len:264 (-) Transcript_26625:191-982(-)
MGWYTSIYGRRNLSSANVGCRYSTHSICACMSASTCRSNSTPRKVGEAAASPPSFSSSSCDTEPERMSQMKSIGDRAATTRDSRPSPAGISLCGVAVSPVASTPSIRLALSFIGRCRAVASRSVQYENTRDSAGAPASAMRRATNSEAVPHVKYSLRSVKLQRLPRAAVSNAIGSIRCHECPGNSSSRKRRCVPGADPAYTMVNFVPAPHFVSASFNSCSSESSSFRCPQWIALFNSPRRLRYGRAGKVSSISTGQDGVAGGA